MNAVQHPNGERSRSVLITYKANTKVGHSIGELSRRGGQWIASLTVIMRGPVVYTLARGRGGKGAGRRASWRKRYTVPLGTADEERARALFLFVTGQVRGPLASLVLAEARMLFAGMAPGDRREGGDR